MTNDNFISIQFQCRCRCVMQFLSVIAFMQFTVFILTHVSSEKETFYKISNIIIPENIVMNLNSFSLIPPFYTSH